MQIRRLITTIVLGGIIGGLFITGTTRSVLALSIDDYFTYTYSFAFSKTNIVGSETFIVTVNGQAICVQDLPLPVSTASIVSKVVARHMQTGTEVVLNPNYSISYGSGFPTQQGQTASASAQVSLSFPSGSPAGVYDITGQILEAQVSVLVITIDVAGYLPSTQLMGTVTYSPPSTGGGGTVTPTTSTTITPSTPTTTPTTTPPTSSTPEPEVPSTTPPTTITPSPASFVLSDLTVKPAVVVTGKTITVTVLLSNTGDISGTYEVVIKLDGQIVNSQSIELAGKSSRLVMFTHLASIEGQHIVAIGDLSKEFSVNAPQITAETFKWWLVGGLAGLGLGLVISCSIIFASRRKKRS